MKTMFFTCQTFVSLISFLLQILNVNLLEITNSNFKTKNRETLLPEIAEETKAEDEIHLLPSKIRLDKFLWSVPGDKPLTFSLNSNARLIGDQWHDHEKLVKTATVIATVYMDSDSEEEENDCKNTNRADCQNEQNVIDISTLDRSYWLMTSLERIMTTDELLKIELMLVELYRMAFNRRLWSHFGILTTPQNISVQNISPSKTFNLSNNTASNITTTVTTESPIDSLNHEINNPISRNRLFHAECNEKNYRNCLIRNIEIKIYNVSHSVDKKVEIINENQSNETKNANQTSNTGERNRTDIIYSVFVQDIPIHSLIALEDIKLLSDDEINEIFVEKIYWKTEVLYGGPHATALKPSDAYFLNIGHIFKDPISLLLLLAAIVFIIICILMLAMLLLSTNNPPKRRYVSREIQTNFAIDYPPIVNTRNVHREIVNTADIYEDNMKTSVFHKENRNTADFQQGNSVSVDMNDYSVINERTSDNEKYESITLGHVDTKSDENLMADQSPESQYQLVKSSSVNIIKPVIQKLYSNDGIKKKKKTNLYAKNKVHRKNIKKRFNGRNSVAPETFDNQITESNRQNLLNLKSAERSLLSSNESIYKVQEKRKYTERINDSAKITEIVQTTSVIDFSENIHSTKLYANTIDAEKTMKSHKNDENCSVNSYLSAESGYAFPDSPNTESLDRILDERNLNNFDDFGCSSNQRSRYTKTSMSHRSDPGFIGPVVWKMHKNYFHT